MPTEWTELANNCCQRYFDRMRWPHEKNEAVRADTGNVMKVIRLAHLVVSLAFALFALSSPCRAEEQLRLVEDGTAEIRIGIPTSFSPESKVSKWGHTWISHDGGVSINSLVFEHGRSIEDIHARLISKKGRILETDSGVVGGRFFLIGADADGSGFYLEARQDGDVVRGFSVIYTERDRKQYAGLVRQVAPSFELLSASNKAVSKPVEAFGDCSAERESVKGLTRDLRVTVSAPDDLRFGGEIAVHWYAPSTFAFKAPVYLVFSTPEEMRVRRVKDADQSVLEGYLALPPGFASAPRFGVRQRPCAHRCTVP